MVDKNRNGIDDALERKPVSTISGVQVPSGTGTYRADWQAKPKVQPNPLAPAQVPNAPMLPGTKQVDNTQDLWQGRKPPMPQRQAPQEQSFGLAEALRQAMELIGSAGGGGGVNFDPQRNTLRQNASDADARLEAMYRQLRGSIDADAPVIQQAYQQAIDSTASNSATAQAQTQAASDNAYSRNNEVLSNLGIQQAQGNQIMQGTDLASQTAEQVGAQATKGQAAGDRLVSNQATALSHNTNIGNAAGLEGNLQRASNQAKLQALLAEIDMQEQSQNASAGQNGFSQQLSVAQALLDDSRYNQERNDNLQMSAAEQANSRYAAELKAQGSQMPDLGTYLKALGIMPEDVAKNPNQYGSLLSALTKFGVTA